MSNIFIVKDYVFHCKAQVRSSTQNLAIGGVSSAGTLLDVLVVKGARLGRFLP